jgi:L-rhamnose isomerase/sugar isomerase
VKSGFVFPIRQQLTEAQAAGDVLGAHRLVLNAFETDVRPLLGSLRREFGVQDDPVQAFRSGGYATTLARERGTASVASAYERP